MRTNKIRKFNKNLFQLLFKLSIYVNFIAFIVLLNINWVHSVCKGESNKRYILN